MVEILSEPYKKGEKLYQKVKKTCPICNGKGSCFFCNNSGYRIEEQRLFTKEEKEKIKADSINLDLTPQQVWFKKNNISLEGKTYLALGDTYALKEVLKKEGLSYSHELKWHAAKQFQVENIQSKEISIYNYFIWDKDKRTFLLTPEGFSQLKAIFNPIIPSNDWIGNIGEKTQLEVTLVKSQAFGYTFLDKENNKIIWKTASNLEFSREKFTLSFFVKSHTFNKKGEKVTYITRAKAK